MLFTLDFHILLGVNRHSPKIFSADAPVYAVLKHMPHIKYSLSVFEYFLHIQAVHFNRMSHLVRKKKPKVSEAKKRQTECNAEVH